MSGLPGKGDDRGRRVDERRQRLKRGALAEWFAAALLTAKGYRILRMRHRTPYGEIDIIAVRGVRLAFVEVKRRLTADAAEAALSGTQSRRVTEAAEYWMSRNPRYREHTMGLDAILVVPYRWPRHLQNALAAL